MKFGVSENIFLASFAILIVMICSMTVAVGSAIFTEVFNDTNILESSQVEGLDANVRAVAAAPIRNCDGIVYHHSVDGIRYVREAGGGVFIAADINDRFMVYKLEQGYVIEIEDIALDHDTTHKLKYALRNCQGPYTPSGMILSGRQFD